VDRCLLPTLVLPLLRLLLPRSQMLRWRRLQYSFVAFISFDVVNFIYILPKSQLGDLYSL
jgi:hypothetical protein